MALAYPLPHKYLVNRPALSLFLPMDFQDSTGRALMENRSLVHDMAEGNMRSCPYEDHRKNSSKPINAGALMELNRHSVRIFQHFAAYASLVSSYAIPRKMTLLEIWRAISIARLVIVEQAIPHLLWEKPLRIDSDVASIFKVSRGLNDLFLDLSESLPSLDIYWSTDQLVSHIEERKMLIGRREVCAAPPELIRRTLDFLVNPKVVPSKLVINSAERHQEFASLYSLLERACFAFELARCTLLRKNLKVPQTRNTFASSVLALKVSQLSHVEKKMRLRNQALLHWHPLHPNLNETLENIVSLALAIDDSENDQATWNLLQKNMLNFIQGVNSLLCPLLEWQPISPYLFVERDLDIFFGESHNF